MYKYLFFLLFFATHTYAQTEAQYISHLAKVMNAESEVSIYGGQVDLMTATHAIEVERASNWKESIGQAMYYSLKTNLKAGIILIKESANEYRYVQMLGSTLEYFGLTDIIQVRVYPDDFSDTSTNNSTPTIDSDYWLTKSSNVRHNSSCRYYKKTRGRVCTKTEGITCKKCGG